MSTDRLLPDQVARMAGKPVRNPIAVALLAVIWIYRRGVSPFLGAHCRFAPTCSAYAAEAIAVHGVLRGSWLAARRISRCHPWHSGGVDLVPQRRVRATDHDADRTGPTGPRDRSNRIGLSSSDRTPTAALTSGAPRC